MAKAIVVFSDGTGNSSAALLRTNVWRLYEALDQSEAFESGQRQIAYYDNGVGTSGFRPLAILGGVFGVGLKRNILDCYKFVCRNYEKGDTIYAFGFSRGAFTIRLLAGLIVNQGLINVERYQGDEVLDRYGLDAYREYRRRFNQTGGLVTFFRGIRDVLVRIARRGAAKYDPGKNLKPGVEFVGVWDTVAAYGMPISELTRGVDRWVWPLSMPNYGLSPDVRRARHALALDDERDTFHPLLWDEVEEQKLVDAGTVPAGRLKQVWFTGMHSDVGGGYPDDSLAYVSLEWMLDEATEAGLRFKTQARRDVRRTANAFGPMHDSRSGLGGYYRYQPRKLSARLEGANDPTTLIVQDPDLRGRRLLTRVQVHESVVRRIAAGVDGYAPIVLPETYDVIRGRRATPALPAERLAPARAREQEAVWDIVWKRRLNYFGAVGLSLAIVSMPWIFKSPAACTGPQCLLSPIIEGAGALLPGFLERWVETFSRNPGAFLLLAIALFMLVKNARRLQASITDTMRGLWKDSFELGAIEPVARSRFIRGLRPNRIYQGLLRAIKWRIVPAAFGISLLVIIFILALFVPSVVYVRWDIAGDEREQRACATGKAEQVSAAPSRVPGFTAKEPCWPTGLGVTEGQHYRISFAVTQQWGERSRATDPRGLDKSDTSRIGRFFRDMKTAIAKLDCDLLYKAASDLVTLRRSITDEGLRPLVKIVPGAGDSHVHAPEVRMTSARDGTFYFAEFKAKKTGEVVLYVNDVVAPGEASRYRDYADNNGAANVCMELITPKSPASQPAQCLAGSPMPAR